MRELYLDDIEISKQSCSLLTESLRMHRCLTHLSVSSCELSSGSALLLSQALSSLEQFQKLNLDGNSLSEAAIEHLQSLYLECGKLLGSFDDNNEVDEEDDDFSSILESINNLKL